MVRQSIVSEEMAVGTWLDGTKDPHLPITQSAQSPNRLL